MTTRDGFSRTIIPFPEGEYMRRWIFQCKWFTVRLHKIQLPDEYRPHNHPWSFVSILLRGRYTETISEQAPIETRLNHVVVRRRLVPVYRHKDSIHRVVPHGTAWSFVITGPKRKVKIPTNDAEFGDASWCFLNEDGTMSHWRKDPITDFQQATYGHETPEV